MTAETDSAGFKSIVEFLRRSRGFDFTTYKTSSLYRRVRRRMETVGIGPFEAYLDHLQVHPEEFEALFNTILINVTTFFRDTEMWDALKTRDIPALLAAHPAPAPIRVWSAGCASGQEACSIAMLLAEALGIESFRERVKIYATDLDVEALAEARRAVYTAKQVTDVPPPLLERYFSRTNGSDSYTFDRDLRRAIIFGRHDVLSDAPISRVDLLFCRNTLMYFNSEAQGRVLARFSFSLNPDGYLIIGRAELLFSHSDLFVPVDLKRRIFNTSGRMAHKERLSMLGGKTREAALAPEPAQTRLREALFESAAEPQLVIDPHGTVVGLNAACRRMFNLTGANVNVPLQNLELSYRPADLRSTMDRVLAERKAVTLQSQPCEQGGLTHYFDVTATPLLEDDGTLLGVGVAYIDVTAIRGLQEELKESKQELETAYEELQSTNEELETTNEELQSTVEELETTNEELQSTNEELETMNEELQSTNEELQTMNDELRVRGVELNASNAFLESVFTSLRAAVVVIDRDFRIEVWNAGALDMWGLRSEETLGSSFFTLDIGMNVAELHQPLRDVLSGAGTHRQLTTSATNRKGRPFQCYVSMGALRDGDGAITGAILLMEEQAPGGAAS